MKEQLKEIWEPIRDYEGLYEISNFSEIKSLKRKTNNQYCHNDKIRIKGLDADGYNTIVLSKNGNVKTIKVCHLVWDHFGDNPRNGRILQIDHIDNNKINDRIDNLQLLSARDNSVKKCLLLKSSSRFTGVSWHKKCKNWVSQINIGRKPIHLGHFENEIDAHNEYLRALKELNETGKITIITPANKRQSSIYRGVYWCKQTQKWKSGITINGKRKHLGYFKDEYLAHLAYKKAKEEK